MRRPVTKFRPLLILMASVFLFVSQFFFISPASAHSTISPTNEKAYLAHLQQVGEKQCLQPPQNVSLLTLSDAQLSLYGLPPHSILNKNPKAWATHLSYAKHRTCGTAPISTHITHLLRPNAPNVSQLNSQNWAGNEAYGSAGTYREANVDFVVPHISGSNSQVSFWAGVGGDGIRHSGSLVLVQAGVDSYLGSSGGQSNLSWWEVAPFNTAQNLPLSRLAAGDEVYAYITSNISNDGYDYFYIDNETVSSYNSYTTYNTRYFSDSYTGECIGERPLVNGSYSNLSNFGTEQLNDCYIGTSAQGQYIENWPHDYYNMINSSGKSLAQVGSTGNAGNYPIYWRAAN